MMIKLYGPIRKLGVGIGIILSLFSYTNVSGSENELIHVILNYEDLIALNRVNAYAKQNQCKKNPGALPLKEELENAWYCLSLTLSNKITMNPGILAVYVTEDSQWFLRDVSTHEIDKYTRVTDQDWNWLNVILDNDLFNDIKEMALRMNFKLKREGL